MPNQTRIRVFEHQEHGDECYGQEIQLEQDTDDMETVWVHIPHTDLNESVEGGVRVRVYDLLLALQSLDAGRP